MISITIQNPHEHSPIELRLLGDYLYNCAHEKDGHVAARGPKLADVLEATTPAEQFESHMDARRDVVKHFTIDPADRPDAGAPTIEPVAATEPDDAPTVTPEPTAVFGVPPAPTVPLPPASTVTVVGVGGEGERDSAGVVWNADLHSRTKSKNADGTWRAKRGVAKGEAETPAPAPTPAADAAPWPFTPPAGIVPPPAPAIPPAPPAVADVAPPPVPPAPANIVSFPALMQTISAGVVAGKITQDQVLAIVTRLGVPSLPLLAARPDLIPTVSAEIDALVGA